MPQPLMSMRLESQRFSRFLRDYIKRCDENAETALREVAMAVLAKVIIKNPVDTGRSRAGWTAAGEMLGIRVPAGSAGLEQGERGEATLTGSGARYTMRLTNGVEYTVHLERGTSTQAPFGMVRVSMREVEEEYGGSQALPTAVRRVYEETWENLGLPYGSEMRARLIAEALDLTEGMNVGAV